MRVEIISVPFDSGLRDTRMGRGPAHLLQRGLASRMQALGFDVRVHQLEPSSDVFPSEIRLAFELQRAVSLAVSGALERGSFPLVLAGNCNVAVGVVGGIRAALHVTPSVCWFDAHADFNTPETTIGGFLDGMAVSMLTGHCWRELTKQVPGFVPVPETQLLMIGTRDIDPLERKLLEDSSVRIVAEPADAGDALESDLAATGARDVYVHLDLDALDVSEGSANGYAAPDGLTRTDLLAAVQAIGARGTLRAASITAYDPAYDTENRIAEVAIEVATRLVSAPRQNG